MIQFFTFIINNIYKPIRAIARKDTPQTTESFKNPINWSDLSIYKSILIVILKVS